MRRRILVATFGILAVAALPLGSFAAVPADAPCIPQTKIDALHDFEARADRDQIETIRAELSLRKELLTLTLDCALSEVRGLRNSLASLRTESGSVSDLKTRYLEKLTDVERYYLQQKTKVPDLGIWGSQDLARSTREWRSKTYVPLGTATIDLIIWVKNQALFTAAENRVADVGRTVQVLKLTDNDDIQSTFKTAESAMRDAETANGLARQALEAFGADEDPLPVIKNSLDLLSKTYKHLFDLRETIKKVLPQ